VAQPENTSQSKIGNRQSTIDNHQHSSSSLITTFPISDDLRLMIADYRTADSELSRCPNFQVGKGGLPPRLCLKSNIHAGVPSLWKRFVPDGQKPKSRRAAFAAALPTS
jgi:hypothetical protein